MTKKPLCKKRPCDETALETLKRFAARDPRFVELLKIYRTVGSPTNVHVRRLMCECGLQLNELYTEPLESYWNRVADIKLSFRAGKLDRIVFSDINISNHAVKPSEAKPLLAVWFTDKREAVSLELGCAKAVRIADRDTVRSTPEWLGKSEAREAKRRVVRLKAEEAVLLAKLEEVRAQL